MDSDDAAFGDFNGPLGEQTEVDSNTLAKIKKEQAMEQTNIFLSEAKDHLRQAIENLNRAKIGAGYTSSLVIFSVVDALAKQGCILEKLPI